MLIMTQPAPFGTAPFGTGTTRSWSDSHVMQTGAGYWRIAPLGVRRLDLPITNRDRAARFAAKQASPPREEHR